MQQEARRRLWPSSSTNKQESFTTTTTTSSSYFYNPLQPPPTSSSSKSYETASSSLASSFCIPHNTMSNGRDRTSEFQTTVKQFANRRNGLDRPLRPSAPLSSQRNQMARQQHALFMQQAKKIGHDLSETFIKLEQLTMLAKQSSLFFDKSADIQELTVQIKNDMTHLNKEIAHLQVHHQETHGAKSKNSQTHSNSVVFVLQSKLANMSNDFKQVLEARTQNLKEQKSRRENFSKNTVASSLIATPPISNGRPSILFRDDQQHNHANGDAVINLGSDGHPLLNQSMQQQLQQIDETESYISSRSDAMQHVEETIVELGDIFMQLATMVKEQGEFVDRIDTNVNDATHHIEGAHTELLKYLRSVTSNRWLIIKVFAVLIFFFLIFIVFLA